MIRLAVCTPHTGTIKTKTVLSLFRMFKAFPHEYNFLTQEGSVLHDNRRRLVKGAQKMNATHLLFVDSDMTFESDAVLKLLAHDKDIIGVHANCRALPLKTTVELKPGQTELKELDTCNAIGTGFLLIKMEVFNKIKEPWFFWKLAESGDTIMGEDHWFCEKAKESGYEIWVDTKIKIGHLGEYEF